MKDTQILAFASASSMATLPRLFDMMRTSTNVLGDASCAVIINRMMGKETAAEEPPEGVPEKVGI